MEQLRSSLEFYELLMSTETLVDRTLLVQLNMQMSTETIRSSLQASWTMLTEEMKNLLLNSSFKARQAESSMLAKISSPLNPSRCSCGQLAPESYRADPSCCSRGTELVFTWRKNGNLEVRTTLIWFLKLLVFILSHLALLCLLNLNLKHFFFFSYDSMVD